MRKHLQGRGHPPALLFLGVWMACEALLHGGALAKSPPMKLPATPQNNKAPVSFRMDALTANLKGQSVVGCGNVVVRQDIWLLCCDRFEAQSSADGQLRTLRCIGRVRGAIDGRNLWADEALFTPNDHLIVLTGHPRVTQGMGHLEGSKMTVRTDTQAIAILGPKGLIAPEGRQAAGASPIDPARPQDTATFLQGPLADRCPWPWP